MQNGTATQEKCLAMSNKIKFIRIKWLGNLTHKYLPEKSKNISPQNTCLQMLIAASFKLAKISEQFICLVTD